MGGGSYSSSSFSTYASTRGFSYSVDTDRISGHVYTSSRMKESLNPKNKIRECCNSKEHPNTVPVILALDVTGSMGRACDECAATLSQIMKELYNRFEDVELMVMGVGDFECDDAPLQVSQFESDVRIAEQLDDIYMEHGGGGNMYESYTAPWWYGLYRTRLDCYDKQGRKGIIITMGDEPLNPSLPKNEMISYFGRPNDGTQCEYAFNTDELYAKASEKFDIYHITINDPSSAYGHRGNEYKGMVDSSFKKVLGQNYSISTVENLKDRICECIGNSINCKSMSKLTEDFAGKIQKDENGCLIW